MSSSSAVTKKAKLEEGLKLTELPNEVLDIILQFLEFHSVVHLVNAEHHSNPKFLTMVQEWQCAECKTTIFDVSTATNGAVSLSLPPGAEPFLCGGACGRKSCGHDRCKSAPGRKCRGCSKMECRPCRFDSSAHCVICSYFVNSYCTDCQGTCDKECSLCQFSICQHHGDRCDKCGVLTCGIHDYSVTKCDHCQISLCDGCHNHGDGMFHCGKCNKVSCNAKGTGCKECPEFHFDGYGIGWPICVNCCFEASNGGCCDKCGVKTCACHDSSLDKCDYCETSICIRCQEDQSCLDECDYCKTSICIRCQEDENHIWMWNCAGCGKQSCNADGSGSSGCPAFDFDVDEDGLCPKCVVEYQEEEDEEDGDTSTSGTGERGEENEDGEECQTSGRENHQEKEREENESDDSVGESEEQHHEE